MKVEVEDEGRRRRLGVGETRIGGLRSMTVHRYGRSGPESLLYGGGLTGWCRRCERVENMSRDDGVSPLP